MTDIIERLRANAVHMHCIGCSSVVAEAAEEIEKLRHEVEIWRDRYESVLADAQRMERSFDEAWRQDH